jgi:predicted dinucleotide-binding enzyme
MPPTLHLGHLAFPDFGWLIGIRESRRADLRTADLPTAKSFNTNFAALYNRIGEARSTPSNLWCGDEEARQVVEQLNRDAGYEPVYAGPLQNAALQENFLKLVLAINRGGLGRFFYRMAPPDQL